MYTGGAKMCGPFTGDVSRQFLGGDLPPKVDGAIGWFLAGLHEIQPPRALMFNWMGIEMLAPEKKGVLRCPNKGCEKPISFCPECKNSTESKKATAAIIDYISKSFAVSRTAASKLYDGRNDVAHGRIGLDSESLKSLSEQVRETSRILLEGIKMALSWPKASQPTLPEYVNHENATFGVKGKVSDPEFSWLLPSNIANWESFEISSLMGHGHGILGLANVFSPLKEVRTHPQN